MVTPMTSAEAAMITSRSQYFNSLTAFYQVLHYVNCVGC
jgi:hypothetical protein